MFRLYHLLHRISVHFQWLLLFQHCVFCNGPLINSTWTCACDNSQKAGVHWRRLLIVLEPQLSNFSNVCDLSLQGHSDFLTKLVYSSTPLILLPHSGHSCSWTSTVKSPNSTAARCFSFPWEMTSATIKPWSGISSTSTIRSYLTIWTLILSCMFRYDDNQLS